MGALEEWAEAVCRELDLPAGAGGRASVAMVLDLARDVAHGVARPAAPLTTYLVGLAAGRADDPVTTAADLAKRIGALAEAWPSGPGTPA